MGRANAVFWTRKKIAAAQELALGYIYREVAEKVGVKERTIKRWMAIPEFRSKVVELSLEAGVACKAFRLQLINRAVRQYVNEAGIKTGRDVLDWLKEARLETDGEKIRQEITGKDGEPLILRVKGFDEV